MDKLSVYRPCNLIHTQEKISRYQVGGYHPVRLGDTFKDGRYKVHHKLGWGGFATVWLVRDKTYATTIRPTRPVLLIYESRKQWVSLKILTAESSKDPAELRNIRSLAGPSQGALSSNYIIQLQDTFLHQGPNGRHQCLVFELLGPTINTVLRDYSLEKLSLEPETILRMSRQLLQAVAFIHEAGYAHGGMV